MKGVGVEHAQTGEYESGWIGARTQSEWKMKGAQVERAHGDDANWFRGIKRLVLTYCRWLSYLGTKHDVDVLVRGLRAALKIAHTAPMTSVTDVHASHPELDHHFSRLSDAELADVVRDRVETVYHPIGTCSMGAGGVVDSDLRVKGTQGLRVCDASVFPKLVSGHPAGAVIATAEKLADIIKAHYA